MKTTKYLWYASFGSNMREERLLAYIQGLQAEGASRREKGCRDHALPIENRQISIPYPLYFAQKSSLWLNKGVAFIDVTKKLSEKDPQCTWGRIYLITEEQFIDLVSQENGGRTPNEPFNFEKFKKNMTQVMPGWYGTIVYLGEERGSKDIAPQNYPIFTFTNKTPFPINSPSDIYLTQLIIGLYQTFPNSHPEDFVSYLLTKPGISNGEKEKTLLNKLVRDIGKQYFNLG